MILPEDARLAYIVTGETYYGRSLSRAERNTIEISADTRDVSGNHTGCLWSFTVYERHDLGSETCLQMELFSDAFAAFHQVPELFDALGEQAPAEPNTLAELRTLLHRLGAVDVTKRHRPATARPARDELAGLIDAGLMSGFDLEHVLDALDANPDVVARFALESTQRRTR